MQDDKVVHLNQGSLLLLAVLLFELLVGFELFDLLALDLLDLEDCLGKIELESDQHFDDLYIGHPEDQLLFLHDFKVLQDLFYRSVSFREPFT